MRGNDFLHIELLFGLIFEVPCSLKGAALSRVFESGMRLMAFACFTRFAAAATRAEAAQHCIQLNKNAPQFLPTQFVRECKG